MAAIGLFLVEHESLDGPGPGMPEGSKDWRIPRGLPHLRGDWQHRMPLTFQRAVALGVGAGGGGGRQIGSRKTTHGACRSPKLLLGQIRCVGGLSLSALIGNITGLVAFIHTMILFTHLLDLVKKI